MNNDIKEILNDIVKLIKYEDYNEFLQLKCKILDYITNLQDKIDKANEDISSILYSYDERMYEYCDVNYIEELRKLKKELGGDDKDEKEN